MSHRKTNGILNVLKSDPKPLELTQRYLVDHVVSGYVGIAGCLRECLRRNSLWHLTCRLGRWTGDQLLGTSLTWLFGAARRAACGGGAYHRCPPAQRVFPKGLSLDSSLFGDCQV